MKYVKPWKKDYPLAAAAGVNKKKGRIKWKKSYLNYLKNSM